MLKIVSFFLILMTAVSVDFPEPNHCFEYIDDARNEPFYVSEEVVVDFGWGGIDARQLGGFMYSYECAKLEGGEEVNYEVTNAADDDGPEWKAPPHSFEPGEYVVSASITSYDTMEGEGYQCYIVIAAEDPTAVIEGGSSRVVAPNLAFKVDGSQSTNSNLKDDPHKGLTYLWTCTQLKTPPSFCKGDWTFNEKVVTIPGKLAVDEDEFVFTLTVSTEWDTHDNTSQTIYVLKNSVNLVIDCKKNCPPVATYSDVKSSTFLEGFCHQSCKLVNDNDLVWTIASKTKSSFTFNYKTSTRFGREGRKFLIKENVLKPGIYNISLQLKAGHQRSGYSNIIIEVPGPAEVKDCRVTPEKGESLKTRFTFKCVQVPPNDRNYYELVYKDTTDPSKTTSVIEGYYPNVFRQTFVLSSSKNKKLQAIITKTGHPTNVVPLKVEVISSLANKPTKEVIKIVTNVYNGKTPSQSVEQLARSTDIVERRKAMQIMTSLVEELVDTKIEEDPQFTNFIRTLKIRATKDLLSTSPSKVSTILKMGDTLTKLNNFQSPTTDPEIAKISTSVCDKITDKMLNVMKEKQNLLNMAEESKSVARFVSRCLKSHAKENLKILEPLKLNISKKIRPPPSEGQPVLVEDYPDYEDHGPDYYNNLRDLTIATGNTLNASSKMAKVMAFTTAIGEGIVKTEGKFDTTLVLKDLGKEIADSRMASDGVVLIPSQDFAGETHPFDVFLTIWKQDIMWWNPNHTRVATNIAIIQFWHSTCKKRIYDFQQPVEIFFTKRPDFVFTRNSEKNVFRISDKCGRISCNQILQFAVPKRRMLHVEFSNFTEKNSLKFITTYFKFPTMGDFHNGTINEFDTLNISFINREDYDVLVYIGILSVYNKTETSIHFNVHSKVTNCLRWNREAIQWELSCYPGDGGNSSVIHCKCYHFSAIAGYFENINFLEKTVLMPDLELQVVSTKVIFLTFVVTLCVFHVLVIFVLLPKKKICVYYLADNNTKHRFAYLVTVKTGLKLSASTSSNVTIRLHGENKSSEPHVLNYPDPRKSLLQNFGEDLFLLATESSLGELEEIELWFDSVGVNPTWHCREIYVYDMQQHQEWRFKIQVKFSVLKGFTYYAVEPFKQKETIIKRKFRVNLSQKFHVWYWCQEDEQISYLQKLTIVFSTVLTIYFLALLCYGLPKLEPKDCLDTYVMFHVNYFTFLVAFVSSFFSFVLHSLIIWGFRLSKFQNLWHGKTVKVPLILTIACWSFLVGLIIISTTFLIIYGFWVTYYRSLLWLTSCLIGIAFDIFIYESTCSIIQNFFMKIYFKDNVEKMYQHILNTTEYQRKYLRKKFGNLILRPYFQHLYKPLRKRRVKEVRRLLIHRYSVISEFEDLLMFIIYIIILYVVVLANKDRLMVVSKNDMRDLLTGLHTRSITFEDLDSLEEIYDYINRTLIDVLHAPEWYENFSIYDPGLMIDMVNKYIGVARIRQQRIEPNSCEVASKMRFLNLSCWPEYSLRFLETKTFDVGWKEEINPIAATHDRLHYIWQYQSEQESGSSLAFGQFASYTGGGYIHYLGRTMYNSLANFLRMLQDTWIDPRSRVIFVEFLTYNPNFNVFSSIRLMIEQSASGYILRDVSVHCVRMLFVQNEVEKISSIFFVLFVLWVIILLLKQSVGTVKKIRSFYRDTWFLIDMIIVLMSLTCIIMFGLRMKFVGRYLDKIEKAKHNEFVNYFYLFQIEYGLNFVAACLLCTATVRLWKFLRFAAMFRVMEQTLLVAGKLLLSFSVAILVMLLSFAFPLSLLLGNYFGRIHTPIELIKLMLLMTLKPKAMRLTDYLKYKVATFYIVLYIIIITVTMYIIIMIIVMSYFEAQLELSSETREYNVKSFVEEKSRYIPRFLKYKYKYLKAGMDVKPKVEPKPETFYYVRCRSITAARLKRMTSIARCIFRNQTLFKKSASLSENEVKMMLKVCRDYFLKSDKENAKVFFIGHVHGKRRQFVEEEKVTKVANVVNYLLQDEAPQFGEEIKKVLDKKLQNCVEMIEQKQETLKRCDLMLKLCVQKLHRIQKLNIKKIRRYL